MDFRNSGFPKVQPGDKVPRTGKFILDRGTKIVPVKKKGSRGAQVRGSSRRG